MSRIAIVGDYSDRVTAHRAIPRALELAREGFQVLFEARWLWHAPAASGALAQQDALMVLDTPSAGRARAAGPFSERARACSTRSSRSRETSPASGMRTMPRPTRMERSSS